jgi:hypothetical protein
VYDLIYANRTSFNASSTPTVIGGHPDFNTLTFPTIIINPVEVGEEQFTLDGSSTNKSITVIVEVYTKKEKDLDDIGDGLTLLFRTNTINGLSYNGCSESNGVSLVNESKVKQKTLSLSFFRR